jgi:hypothetical protein
VSPETLIPDIRDPLLGLCLGGEGLCQLDCIVVRENWEWEWDLDLPLVVEVEEVV